MKQEKGITMVSLVIIIVLMLVLAVIGVNTATPLLKKSNVEDVTTELMLIQAKWKTEREKVNFDGESIFDEDLINPQESENKGKLKEEFQYTTRGEEWVESDVTYYKLPDKALENMGLVLEENFGYLVNYENDEIIYVPGIEDENGKMYYKLSEINGL